MCVYDVVVCVYMYVRVAPTVYKFPTTNSQNSTNSNSPNENNNQMNLLSHSPTHFIVLLALLLLCCTTTTTLAQLHIVEYDGKDFNCSSTPLRIRSYSTSPTCARGVSGPIYHARCTPGGAYEIRSVQEFTIPCSNPLSDTPWESGIADGVCNGHLPNQLSYRVFCQNSTVSPIENLPKPTAPATTFVYQEYDYTNNVCNDWRAGIETTQNFTTNACFKRFQLPPAIWKCEKDGVTVTWWDSPTGMNCNTGTRNDYKIPFGVCTKEPKHNRALMVFSCSPVSHANGANLIGHLLMSAVIMLGPLFFT